MAKVEMKGRPMTKASLSWKARLSHPAVASIKIWASRGIRVRG
jgi:hypothetical protein